MKKTVNWKLVVDEIDNEHLDISAINFISNTIKIGFTGGQVNIILPELTKEDKQRYITGGGNQCPWCEDGDIEGRSIEIDNQFATQFMICKACDKAWTDIYKLIDIEPID